VHLYHEKKEPLVTACRVRDEIVTRYAVAVQDKAVEEHLTKLRRELQDHDASCGCLKTNGLERLIRGD